MFMNEYPIFLRKHLLKIEMLENLRDYPRDLAEVYYKNYSNGILSGCELEVSGQYLVLHPGIMIFNHQVYVLKEEERVPYQAEDCNVYLKIKFMDAYKDLEKTSYMSQVVLDTEEPNQKEEIELCRFRLQKGNKLRNEYVDFEDFSTTYDTLNQIYAPYSGEGESTVWPYLLHSYAKEAMKYRMPEAMDMAFCMSILRDDKAVPRRMLETYLNARLRSEKTKYSNIEIYLELLRLLEDMKDGKNTSAGSTEGRKRIMLV